jgi:hypothetical protein
MPKIDRRKNARKGTGSEARKEKTEQARRARREKTEQGKGPSKEKTGGARREKTEQGRRGEGGQRGGQGTVCVGSRATRRAEG